MLLPEQNEEGPEMVGVGLGLIVNVTGVETAVHELEAVTVTV